MVSPLVLLSQVVVILVLCVLGGFVFRHRGRTRPGQLLALLCFLCAGWIAAILAGDVFPRTMLPGFPLLSRNVGKVFASFTMAALIGFAWQYPTRAPSVKRWHCWLVFLLSLFFAAGSFTRWDARIGGQQQLQYGPLHYCFVCYVVLSGIYALGFLVLRRQRSDSPLLRLQIAWVSVGIGISYVVAVVCVLLLPALWGVHGYQLLGTLAPAIGFLFVTYAIVKYRAMEIEVVLNRTLVWLLTGVLIFAANWGIASLIGGWIRGLNNWQLALIGTLLFYPLFFITRKVQPTINRLLQREYHAMGEAVDGLMAEAGELTDVRTLCRFIIQRTCQVLRVPHVALLLCDERLERCLLIDREHEEQTPLTPGDPFLVWLAENAVTLEREQVELRQRHEAIRPLADAYFQLVAAEACLTLVHGGKLVGTLNLGRRSGKRGHLTKRELGLLVRFRAAITLALENARMHESELSLKEEKVKAEFFARELQEAHQMQAALLPRDAPRVAGLEAAGDCRPAQDVGGDFFDYLPSGDGRVSVILGDVSGKGLRSAMHAVLSSGLLRTQVRVGGTPGEVLDEVDRELFHLTERNIFTALVFAAIDSRQRKLVLVNAGLPQPLLRRGGEVRLLTLGGLPLGVMPRAQRQTVTAKLETDDLLLFYSDGITEASNLAGEMYSQERLQALVAGVAPDTPAAAVNRLIWEDVDRFVGGAEPFDDMTLVVVRITDR